TSTALKHLHAPAGRQRQLIAGIHLRIGLLFLRGCGVSLVAEIHPAVPTSVVVPTTEGPQEVSIAPAYGAGGSVLVGVFAKKLILGWTAFVVCLGQHASSCIGRCDEV